jgi:PUA domain protein
MNMKIKQRHFIKSSEIKILKDKIIEHYDQGFVEAIFPKKAKVEVIQTDAGDTLYAVNKVLKLWKSNEGYIPVLTLLLNKQVDLKKIVVDKGAIRFVTNAADVMRPGITYIEPSIKKGDIVVIVDENHDRALAIGKALLNADQMQETKTGKVVKNLHTIQDNVWKFEKEFR